MTDARPGPLPSEPLECRQHAERLMNSMDVENPCPEAVAWALLAIAGELREIRAELRRRR